MIDRTLPLPDLDELVLSVVPQIYQWKDCYQVITSNTKYFERLILVIFPIKKLRRHLKLLNLTLHSEKIGVNV